MLANLFHNPIFKKVWLGAAIIVGVLSILSGIILAARGRPESGAAGIVGGAILVSIGLVGFRTLARTPLHNV
jgi:predicted metal-binding membrane protein